MTCLPTIRGQADLGRADQVARTLDVPTKVEEVERVNTSRRTTWRNLHESRGATQRFLRRAEVR